MRVMNLPLSILWSKFQPGTSFFIPCIDRTSVQRFVVKEARRMKLDIVTKQVVERGVYGLRVWRKHPTMDPHSTSRT